MGRAKAIVLRAAGINCDLETQYALELAGATADRIHINQVIENKAMLNEYQIIIFPGGFSYGDDVAAGKILANQIIHHLSDSLTKFVEDGKAIMGICNGFQVLVKTGLLPGFDGTNLTNQQGITITHNDSGKFDDRWSYLSPQTDRCIFIDPDRQIYLPIAHGEGKVITKDQAILDKLQAGGHIAFKYVDVNGEEGSWPTNPNGSTASIAGLTDSTGRVLGLMPHPERFVRTSQHPRWTRDKTIKADGIDLFINSVSYINKHFF